MLVYYSSPDIFVFNCISIDSWIFLYCIYYNFSSVYKLNYFVPVPILF